MQKVKELRGINQCHQSAAATAAAAASAAVSFHLGVEDGSVWRQERDAWVTPAAFASAWAKIHFKREIDGEGAHYADSHKRKSRFYTLNLIIRLLDKVPVEPRFPCLKSEIGCGEAANLSGCKKKKKKHFRS